MVTADGNVDDPRCDMGSLTTIGMISSWLQPTQKTHVQTLCIGKDLTDVTLLNQQCLSPNSMPFATSYGTVTQACTICCTTRYTPEAELTDVDHRQKTNPLNQPNSLTANPVPAGA